MFNWFKKRRRKKILRTPFPQEWVDLLQEKVRHYRYLSAEEQERFRDLVQIFVAEKNYEGCGGQQITEEIKVIIAGYACLLILNLPHDYYAKVESILVYPSTVKLPTRRTGVFTQAPMVEQAAVPIVGQASMYGTVMLVWDEVKKDTTHPRGGHNVVFHEFAHILDMFDGRADGTPTLPTRDNYREWGKVCSRVYFDLQEKVRRGKKTFLDRYGATNEAEFFAVATEYFFNRPVRMTEKRPQLYQVLSQFYRQDTALRLKEYRSRPDSP